MSLYPSYNCDFYSSCVSALYEDEKEGITGGYVGNLESSICIDGTRI